LLLEESQLGTPKRRRQRKLLESVLNSTRWIFYREQDGKFFSGKKPLKNTERSPEELIGKICGKSFQIFGIKGSCRFSDPARKNNRSVFANIFPVTGSGPM